MTPADDKHLDIKPQIAAGNEIEDQLVPEPRLFVNPGSVLGQMLER